jgi:hypothetical protein
MKLSKLVKTFKSFLSWDEEEIKENAVEINSLIKKLYEKKESIKKKLKKCDSSEEIKKLKEKLKAVNKLIIKAEEEFI